MATESESEHRDLDQWDLPQLLTEYRRVWARSAANHNRRYLMRKIIWGRQARREGSLSEVALRRVADLIDPHDLSLAQVTGRTRAKQAKPHKLLPGTILCRRYRGRLIEVKVLEKGFAYQGQVYPTLSRLANEITGSHWNGWKFFGVQRHGKRKPSSK